MSANEEGFEINLPDIFLSHLDTLCTQGSVALGMLEAGKDVNDVNGNAAKETLDVTADMIDASFISFVTSKYDVDDNAVAKYVEEEEGRRARRRNMCLCLLLLLVVMSIAIVVPIFMLGDFAAASAVRSFFGGTGMGTDTNNATATNNEGAIDTTFNGTLGDTGISTNEVPTKEVEKEEEEPKASSSSLTTNDAMDVGIAATNEEEEKETGEEGEKSVRVQWHDDFADVPLMPSEQSVTITKVQRGKLDVNEPTMPVCGDGIAIISGDLFCYTLDDGKSASRTCKFFKKGDTETRLTNHCNENNLGAKFCEICQIHLAVDGK